MRAATFAGTAVASVAYAFQPAVANAAPATTAATSIVLPAASGLPWTAARRASVAADVGTLLASSPALRGAHVGVYAVETATGTPLVSYAADQLFAPASTLKLLVGSVALERLGEAYRFRTEASLRDGTLGVAASGDPLLTTDDLRTLVAALGTRPVDDVAIDATRYDDARYAPGWTWDDFSFDYAAPRSAATIDENVVTVTATAGARVGADVRLTVGSEAFAPPYRCTATSAFASVATTAAADTTSTLDTRTRGLGCTELVGMVPLGKSDTVDVAVVDPELHYRDAVRSALARRGSQPTSPSSPMTLATPSSTTLSTPASSTFASPSSPAMPSVSASAALATSAAAAVTSPSASANARASIVWTHDSPALGAFLGPRFWIPSDNLVGEALLEELGFVTGGKPGTTLKGIAAEERWLRAIGVDHTAITLADGSGLSQYDRIRPRDLVAILQHDWNGPNRALILASLPVGGARGTIEGIAGTSVAGRVFAKTGSMMHVRGLAGYLATMRHGAVTFAFNVDDWNGDYGALAAVRAAVLARIAND
ncbi:MAG: hypothetical protein NVSMB59_03150 [Vulcanimicrobiaceae bacterium]